MSSSTDRPKYCASCGHKIPGTAQFCPHCGNAVSPHSHSSSSKSQHSNNRGNYVIVVIFAIAIAGLMNLPRIHNTTARALTGIISGIVFIATSTALIIRGRKRTKKVDNNPKNPGSKAERYIIITAIVISAIITFLVILAGIGFLLQPSPRTDAPKYISVIRDSTAEADAAKQVGDAIAAKQPTAYNLGDVSNAAVFAQTTISATFPQPILGYTDAVFNWGKAIQSAAVSGNWASVPDQPGSSKLSLSTGDAIATYNDAINDVKSDQAYGNYYIAKGDRGKMRWVAARLDADEVYLDTLSQATVSVAAANSSTAYATSYGSQCYYGRGHILVRSKQPKPNNCVKKLADTIRPLRTAAQNYTLYGQPQAVQDWTVAVKGMQAGGYPISQTGASVGSGGTVTPPPAILAFQEACTAKGGTTPAGLTKNRLPTTESGLTCAFKGLKGGTCWDFQTDTGQTYAGGDADCPEKNLLPAVAIRKDNQASASQQTANPYPWDGTYKTSPNITCSTGFSSTSLNGDIMGFMTGFTVQHSHITHSQWYTNYAYPPAGADIDQSGNAAETYNDTQGSSAVEYTQYTAHFANSGGAVTVNGNLNGHWYFKPNGVVTNCQGTFSGQRAP